MTGIFEGTRLGRSRRLIVKVGSTLLVDHGTRTIRRDWLMGLAGELAALRGIGCDVLVVSSGAIALGRRILGLNSGQLRLEESQAAASAGQIALAGSWAEVLGQHGLVAGQILLTLNDTEERRRYLNARATLNMLLKRGAVPVINENDTVATSEIRYGDNDRLAARVASMISADCLVLLSDVEGLFSAPPGSGSETFIDSVEQVTAEIEAMAGRPASGMGSGGMVTKLEAARIATAAGCGMVIALGRRDNPLSAIATGQRCTWFRAEANPAAARKRWIAGTLVPTGRLIIDAGAARALASGKSLLPAGVSAIHGQFARGDAVSIVTAEGKEIARGLVAYDCADAARIAGRRSAQIEEALGFRGRDEMVHRDDLVLTGS